MVIWSTAGAHNDQGNHLRDSQYCSDGGNNCRNFLYMRGNGVGK